MYRALFSHLQTVPWLSVSTLKKQQVEALPLYALSIFQQRKYFQITMKIGAHKLMRFVTHSPSPLMAGH